MRLLRMHLQSLVADTTHGTNAERKELFAITGVDGNNNAFNAYRAYTPSLQSWVFELLFRQCISFFLKNNSFSGKTFINRWSHPWIFPFITNVGHNNPFVSSCHGLWYYHLTVQDFQRNASSYIPNDNRSDVICNEYIKLFRLWVKSCFFTIQTEIEYNYSRNF